MRLIHGLRLVATMALTAISLVTVPRAALAQPTPVVVELYTSQGCDTCPPADALLAELAERPGVIALSLHVDYWNYLGWRDPFASAENTRRQRGYAAALGSREVYTPQMVVQGAHGMVGSRAQVVEMAIKGHAGKPPAALVALSRRDGTLEVRITPGDGNSAGEVWLFGYDATQETKIESGENSGRTYTYHNVVRETRRLDDWTGAARSLSVAIDPARHGYAVVVQRPHLGPVLGAAKSERGDATQ